MESNGPAIWKPFREPLRNTLARTATIALIVGIAAAWRAGGLKRWPLFTLLALWISLGGHWIEYWFLNWLRPRLPIHAAIQAAARTGIWFFGGIFLMFGIELTAEILDRAPPQPWPAWWIGGTAFIGIELLVHLLLLARGQSSFFNGRG